MVRRPGLSADTVDRVCPRGLFVARGVPSVPAGEGWGLSPWTATWIRSRIGAQGPLPFVATVGGLVHTGADVVDLRAEPGATWRLELRDPGRWFEELREHRAPTGAGRPWVLHGGPWGRRAVG